MSDGKGIMRTFVPLSQKNSNLFLKSSLKIYGKIKKISWHHFANERLISTCTSLLFR